MSIGKALREILTSRNPASGEGLSSKARGILKACGGDVDLVNALAEQHRQDPDLFSQGSLAAICRMASSDTISEADLRKLAASQREEVAATVAQRKDLPPGVLEFLLESQSWVVLKSVSKNAGLGPAGIRLLLRKGDWRITQEVLRRKDLPRDVQVAFTQHSERVARVALAENSSILDEVFILLAKDPESAVRSMLGRSLSSERIARVGLSLTPQFVKEQRGMLYLFPAMVAGARLPPDEVESLATNWSGTIGDLFEAVRLTKR